MFISQSESRSEWRRTQKVQLGTNNAQESMYSLLDK